MDGAFGEAGVFGHALVAEGGGIVASAFGLAPDVEIYEEGGGGFVVAYQVAHQDVEDVFVEFCHEGQYTWAALSFSLGHKAWAGRGPALLAAEDELVSVQVLEDCRGAPGFNFWRRDEFDAFGF